VVKLLVEAMGGSIDVESEIEIGSRFHIHLPAA
jgi:signal transduction histidine kinase